MHPAEKKVFVSDGDDIVLALISYILHREGFDVETVSDREELLRLLAEGSYDAFIADAHVDGVLEAVRKAPAGSAARIILTAVADVDGNGSTHAILRKPLEFGQLIETVRNCVAPPD